MFLECLSVRNKMNCEGMIHCHFCEETFGRAFLCREIEINKIIAHATCSLILDLPRNNFALE